MRQYLNLATAVTAAAVAAALAVVVAGWQLLWWLAEVCSGQWLGVAAATTLATGAKLLWLRLLCLRLVPLAGVVAATAAGRACCCNNYCFWRPAAAVGFWRWPAAAGCGSCWLVLWLLLLDTVAAASCSSSLG